MFSYLRKFQNIHKYASQRKAITPVNGTKARGLPISYFTFELMVLNKLQDPICV